ncbi:MAG: hypothetical protein MUC56_04690 [Thermoanaerobaculales bacterium]|jgi:hypothetical protein|nr:hypothetical protein [Thermoanaerobaculales bacterium]
MPPPAPPPSTDAEPATPSPHPRPAPPAAIVVIAVLVGLICGAHQIANTSIGWHIASGRWMIEHRALLDHDVFSFTSGGVEWIDHEWLFQILVAALYDHGGAPALVVLRMAVLAALAVLLLRIGTASGLSPPVALLLATLSLLGARPRFFLRPELATLLLLPLALWIFADRRGRRWWPAPLAAVIGLGVNLHGAMLVAPILVTVWFAGEALERLLGRTSDGSFLGSGLTGVAASWLATVLNPHGLAIWSVPLRLAEMVRMPHIPNPEWIAPGPADAPALFVALAVAGGVLLAGRAAPQSWLGVAATTALALRHVRNIGVFFVLLPQSVAPALARLEIGAARPAGGRERLRTVVCLGLVAVLAVAAALRPWPLPGFGFAEGWYPERAWAFLERYGLLEGRLYNDVRFGGWLILRGYPDRRVFLDDRNEIHEPLLREIWEILERSDVAAWEGLLKRWGIDTVLLRYHEPVRVTTPDGRDLGRRGFSALWFPTGRWATVYWDDVAIVLVRRSSASEELLAEREYRLVQPDDLEHLAARLRADPELAAPVAAELERALADDPRGRRAREIAALLDPS